MKRAIAALAGAAALLAAAPRPCDRPGRPREGPAEAAGQGHGAEVHRHRLVHRPGGDDGGAAPHREADAGPEGRRRRRGACPHREKKRRGPPRRHRGRRAGDRRRQADLRQGGILSRSAPEGKTWVKLPRASLGLGGRYSQTINPAEPATLKALITSGEKSGRTYTGKISEGELWKNSSWFRLSKVIKPTDPEVLEYRLTLSAGELPARLVTTFPAASGPWRRSHNGGETISVDTRYTGWGSKVRISAPARSQVHEVKR
ncbi:hypothetical protein ACFSTC_25530 [Nonomuraea ferruginea]